MSGMVFLREANSKLKKRTGESEVSDIEGKSFPRKKVAANPMKHEI